MSALAAPQKSNKIPNIALWAGQVLLAAAFAMAGVMKSTAPIAELAAQMKWPGEVAPEMVRFIGISELLGALGLLLPSALRIAPKLTPLAAVGLATIMVLAAAHHLRAGDGGGPVVVNVVLGGIALAIAWGRLRVAPIAPRG